MMKQQLNAYILYYILLI